MPLVPLGEQCYAPNSTMSVVSICSHVFIKVVKFYEVLGVLCHLFSCACNMFMFIVVSMCVVLFLFVIVSMCVSFKSQD